MAEICPIDTVIAFDFDNSLGRGVPQLPDMAAMVTGRMKLPDLDNLREKNKQRAQTKLGLLGQAMAWLDSKWYSWRYVKEEPKEFLPRIVDLFKKRGYKPAVVVLSGRGERRRDVTEKALRKAGMRDQFDGIYLDNKYGSAATKAMTAAGWVEAGRVVMTVDDNLRTVLTEYKAHERASAQMREAGQEPPRFFGYITNIAWQNPFYLKPFLKLNGIDKLPPGVKIVSGYRRIYSDLYQNLPNRRQAA